MFSTTIVCREKTGFTLVELSVVLVIIGFLVAGVSAGANMVKQAQIRSVISDLVGFQASYNGFVSRYNKIPGDMDIASAYWPGANNCATTVVNCNGNGNGVINFATGARGNGTGDETERAWKHMALAGVIGQGIVEVADSFTATAVGTNAPAGRITGTGFMIGSGTLGTGVTSPFAATTSIILVGRSATNNSLVSGALKPEDAFNLDVKVDDGIVSGGNFQGANTGFFRTINGLGSATCLTGNNYNIATTTDVCISGLSLN
jgi:prepilin-type N-terminal cleavage/methylation domain-containing protein